jgi:hypothetical protein
LGQAAPGGPDKIETKLLFQHRQGAFDGRPLLEYEAKF